MPVTVWLRLFNTAAGAFEIRLGQCHQYNIVRRCWLMMASPLRDNTRRYEGHQRQFDGDTPLCVTVVIVYYNTSSLSELSYVVVVRTVPRIFACWRWLRAERR